MIKTGIITVLVALPSLYKPTAGWAYRNKAIWPVIMSQLVAARHRGEVLFGLASRAIATFAGAIIGLLIWYIASGNGVANPFAMAVVTAVAFPIVMLGRIHFPGPPITPIIACVTVALVVGYSWKDSHNTTPLSIGQGWSVAWRRFVEVVVGAAAAYFMAVLPPSSSMRTYFRLSHATVIRETGGLFCNAITNAANPKREEDTAEILNQLLAVRSKIRRLALLKASISYEWSLRGKWPLHRYNELERMELRVLRLITHAVTIHDSLEPAYSRALLDRTHFLDPLFLAGAYTPRTVKRFTHLSSSDCIVILSMCTTSLRTAQPLPLIVPVLIDRYLSRSQGFKVRKVFSSSDSTYGDQEQEGAAQRPDPLAGLPQTITFDTLNDLQYQTFAVGAQIAFGSEYMKDIRANSDTARLQSSSILTGCVLR